MKMLTEADIQEIADGCGDAAIADIQALLKRKGKEHEVAADKLQILRSAIVALVFAQLRSNSVPNPGSDAAIEVFPSKENLVDAANCYHLWVLPRGFEFPFGLHFVGWSKQS